MRICTRISTGKIIEMQSDATAGTLIANAVGEGISASDLLEEVITPIEYETRMASQEPPPIDFSNIDNVEKALKALGLVMASWNGKTTAQLKTAFTTAWNSLP